MVVEIVKLISKRLSTPHKYTSFFGTIIDLLSVIASISKLAWLSHDY